MEGSFKYQGVSTGGLGTHGCTNLGVFVPVWLALPRCEAINLGVFDPCHFYTEQMDAGGLGRKLLLTLRSDPSKNLEILCGYCDRTHTTCSLCKHDRVLSILALQKADERPLGDLRQSVPQNGRVHLHIIVRWPRAVAYFQTKSCKIVSHSVV